MSELRPSFDYSKNMTEGISSENSPSSLVQHKDSKKQKKIFIVGGAIAVIVVALAVLLVIFLKPEGVEEHVLEEIGEIEITEDLIIEWK